MSAAVQKVTLSPKAALDKASKYQYFYLSTIFTVSRSLYQTAHTLFGTAKEYGAARVRGSSIPEGSIGTVLAIGYCTLKGGRQLLNVTFCTTAHFTPKEPPPGMSWKDWCYSLIELYPPDTKSQIAANVVEIIKLHQFKTKRPIPEGESDPASGVSWKWLCQIINRGDLKGRKQGMLINKAVDACKRLGISYEEALSDVELN